MKNRRYSGIITILFLFSSVFKSCISKETKMLEPSNAELLCSKKWYQIKFETSVDDKTFQSQYLNDCVFDNSLTFNNNGTYLFDPGVDKCHTLDKNLTGTWSLIQLVQELILIRLFLLLRT